MLLVNRIWTLPNSREVGRMAQCRIRAIGQNVWNDFATL